VSDARKLREDKTISLNESVRRKERDEQEAKRRERHPEQFADASATATGKEPASAKTPDAKAGANNVPHKNIDVAAARKAADPGGQNPVAKAGAANAAKVAKSVDNPNQDDGLQADERSLKSDLDEEKRRKALKDVVLNEASHIVADEVELLRADTKLAAQVLPHSTVGRNAVN